MHSTPAKFSPLTALLAMPLLWAAATGIDSNGRPAPIHVVNSSPKFTPQAGYAGDKTLLPGPYLLSPASPGHRPAAQGTLTLGSSNAITFGASPPFGFRAAPSGEANARREPSPARPKMLPPANSDIFRFEAKLPVLAIPLLQRPTYMAPKPNLD